MTVSLTTWCSTAPPTAGPLFAASFTPAERRAGQMRRITAASLRHAGLAPLIDPAVLMVSELVTNAIRHGYGDIALKVVLAGELRIEVTDGNPAPARLRNAAETDESGRGLFLVGAMARTWGVSNDGTTTWCTLPLPERTS